MIATWHRPGSQRSRRLEIEYRRMSVYDVGQLREKFDIVLFLGVSIISAIRC